MFSMKILSLEESSDLFKAWQLPGTEPRLNPMLHDTAACVLFRTKAFQTALNKFISNAKFCELMYIVETTHSTTGPVNLPLGSALTQELTDHGTH